jgi:hypothetical protein
MTLLKSDYSKVSVSLGDAGFRTIRNQLNYFFFLFVNNPITLINTVAKHIIRIILCLSKIDPPFTIKHQKQNKKLYIKTFFVFII